MGARNESKATGALARLEHEGLGPGYGEVIWLKADFGEMRGAKAAALEFLEREERLDVLGEVPFLLLVVLLLTHTSTYSE